MLCRQAGVHNSSGHPATQVCVPLHMATVLTYPERVTPHNLVKLRARVLNGVAVHPGANFIATPDGNKTFLRFGDRRRAAAELKAR